MENLKRKIEIRRRSLDELTIHELLSAIRKFKKTCDPKHFDRLDKAQKHLQCAKDLKAKMDNEIWLSILALM